MDTAEALFETFVKAMGADALHPDIAKMIKKNRALRKKINALKRNQQ